MNIVDALVVSFGIDASEYEKKQKEIATSLTKMGEVSGKQTKLIAESGKKAAGAFSALKIEILGALAAFGMGAGFKAFIESSINGQAELGRLSTRLGMSTHALQAWKLAATEMGGSGSDATNALQAVAKGMAEAKIHGTSALIQASRRFGFGVSNDPAQTLINISRRMAQMNDPQQAIQVAEAAGISNAAMQNLLLQGPDALQARLAHTMALTGAATKASTEQAARLQAQWADLQERFRQVGERVFNKLEPVLARLGETFANWLDHVDWNKVIAAIGAFIDKVQSIVKEMGGWKTVAEILGGVLALKILAPLLTLTGTLARLLPLFVGATTGVAGLAAAFGTLGVAVAAAVGAGIGYEIWKHTLEGNKAGDWVGKSVAEVLADLGIKQAQDAVNQMNGKGPVNHSGDFHPERTMAYKAKASQALQYFMSKAGGGYTQAQAAGIIGNLAQESQLDPNAVNKTSGALGIGQWLGSRARLFEKIEGVPLKGSSFQKQLEFIHWELAHTEKRADNNLRQTTAVPNATLVFGSMYERFGNDGSMGKRVAYANSVLSQGSAYPGAPQGPQVAGAKSSTTTNDVHIGTIAIHTKADNAYDIFKEARKAVNSNPLIAGSVTAAA